MCVKRPNGEKPRAIYIARFRPLTGRCVSNAAGELRDEFYLGIAFPSPYGAMCVKRMCFYVVQSGYRTIRFRPLTGRCVSNGCVHGRLQGMGNFLFPSPYGAMCVKRGGGGPP